MAIREGAWDCPHCGTKRNRGPEKHCSACGSARGPEVQFYLPDDAAVVTDAEALARARNGPDWSCQYCETDNPSSYKFCSSCGASSDGAPPRPVIEHRDKVEPEPAKPEEKKKGCLSGCIGKVFGIGLIVVMLAIFFGGPKEDIGVVEGHRWQRAVEVQALVTETHKAWEGEVPAGARILSQQREIHHHDQVQIGSETKTRTRTEKVQTGTEKVKVGVRDLGNGYFEDIYEDKPVYEERRVQETYQEPVYRKDPVYKIRFTYQVDVWKKARDAVASGNDLNPAWPELKLDAKEREGPRRELYEVLFRDSDRRVRAFNAIYEHIWRGYNAGARYKIEITGNDKVKRVLGKA